MRAEPAVQGDRVATTWELLDGLDNGVIYNNAISTLSIVRYHVDVPQPRDETSTAILEAAGTLLAKEGAEALTVRRIAAAAGCSTMGLYSRFGGKDGVVEHLFIEGFQQLDAAI